jgi:type VI secretion system VasD/TssJ family lipoprotein
MGLVLVADPQLNHDRDGYARSVVLRILQLDDTVAFEQADFESLWQSGAVAGAVAGQDELTVVPGRKQTQQLKRSPKATHLGIAANFREHDDVAGWKTLIKLPPPQDPCGSDDELVPFKLELDLANYSMHVR